MQMLFLYIRLHGLAMVNVKWSLFVALFCCWFVLGAADQRKKWLDYAKVNYKNNQYIMYTITTKSYFQAKIQDGRHAHEQLAAFCYICKYFSDISIIKIPWTFSYENAIIQLHRFKTEYSIHMLTYMVFICRNPGQKTKIWK